METPKTLEEIAAFVEKGKSVFFFKTTWCGDCHFIEPEMPAIEATFPEYRFIEVDRDEYPALAEKWHILGIPSFVVIEDGQEQGRLVNKLRKTKAEVVAFLTEVTS